VTESLKLLGMEFYALGKELAESGISVRLELHGCSMYPFIKDGDVAQITPISMPEAKVGDVIFFRSGDRLLAHRVIRRIREGEGLRLVTRGDNSCQEDSPVSTEADLVGRVEVVYRDERDIGLDRGFSRFLGHLVARSGFAHFCIRGLNRLGWLLVRFRRGLVRTKGEHFDEPEVW
jgi:signal peptidase I